MYTLSKQELDKMQGEMLEVTAEFFRVKGERDVYKKLYEDLMKKEQTNENKE